MLDPRSRESGEIIALFSDDGTAVRVIVRDPELRRRLDATEPRPFSVWFGHQQRAVADARAPLEQRAFELAEGQLAQLAQPVSNRRT